MTLQVKICGITRVEDAKLAEACGAHALGFIFYRPSPRRVNMEAAAKIMGQLHPYTLKVGVFVRAKPARINDLADLLGLDRIQLHGGEPFKMIVSLNRSAYRAFKLKDEGDLEAARAAPDATVMLDTFDPVLHGGTGRPFNWEWAREIGRSHRVILSGGLSPENIAQAIKTAQPMAVDASSSLEAAPGRKDPEKVEAFFRALRESDYTPARWSEDHAIAI